MVLLTSARTVHVQILAHGILAHDDGSPDKLLASTPDTCRTPSGASCGSVPGSPGRAAAAVQRPPAAAVTLLPAKACRLVWDRGTQLRAFWLAVFFCVLGKQHAPAECNQP